MFIDLSVYVYTDLCAYVCVYVHAYDTCGRSLRNTADLRLNIEIQLVTYIYIYICIHTYVCVYICIHIHTIYIYVCIHI